MTFGPISPGYVVFKMCIPTLSLFIPSENLLLKRAKLFFLLESLCESSCVHVVFILVFGVLAFYVWYQFHSYVLCTRLMTIKIFLIVLFIYFGCAGSSLLCGLFCHCKIRGYSLVAVCSLTAVAFCCCWAVSLGCVGPVVAASGFKSTSSVVVPYGLSCPAACRIFPDQGSHPCLLHWQLDPLPLSQQGSPLTAFDTAFPLVLLGTLCIWGMNNLLGHECNPDL